MLTLIIIIVVILVVVWLNSNSSNRVKGNSSRNISKESSKQKFPTVDESQLNDDLSSSLGIDYRKLRNFLAVEDFESANKETITIFTQLIYPNRKKANSTRYYLEIDIDNDEIYQERVERIPCTDICTIDRLWVKYSSGHFGFSIQSEINQQLYKQFSEEIIEFNRREKVNMLEQEVLLRSGLKTKAEFQKQIKWDTDSLSFKGALTFNRSAPRGHLPKILWVELISEYKHQIVLLNRITECL